MQDIKGRMLSATALAVVMAVAYRNWSRFSRVSHPAAKEVLAASNRELAKIRADGTHQKHEGALIAGGYDA